jgi:hypothetical protein
MEKVLVAFGFYDPTFGSMISPKNQEQILAYGVIANGGTPN